MSYVDDEMPEDTREQMDDRNPQDPKNHKFLPEGELPENYLLCRHCGSSFDCH